MRTHIVLPAIVGITRGFGFFGGAGGSNATTLGVPILETDSSSSSSASLYKVAGTLGLVPPPGLAAPPDLTGPIKHAHAPAAQWQALNASADAASITSATNRLNFLEKALAKISYNAGTSGVLGTNNQRASVPEDEVVTGTDDISSSSESTEDSGSGVLSVTGSSSEAVDEDAVFGDVESTASGSLLDGAPPAGDSTDDQTLGLLNAGDINGQIAGDEEKEGNYSSGSGVTTTVAASAGVVAALGGGVMMWRRQNREPAVESFSSFGRRNSNESLSRRYLHV